MAEAGHTQKASKQHNVSWCLKCTKSIYFQENVSELLNLGYFEITKSISRKLVEPGMRRLSLKKGGLGVRITTLHCEMTRKKG